jgi:hypothetical protein
VSTSFASIHLSFNLSWFLLLNNMWNYNRLDFPNFFLCVQVVSLLFGGDISTPAQTFEKWVSLVRKRSGTFRPSGFPRRNSRIEVMPSGSFSLFRSADLRLLV